MWIPKQNNQYHLNLNSFKIQEKPYIDRKKMNIFAHEKNLSKSHQKYPHNSQQLNK
jgi:hypothetical protein